MARRDFEVRDRRPRLFVDPDLVDELRRRLSAEQSERFRSMRSTVDQLRRQPIATEDWGEAAATAAFVFSVTEDEIYRDVAEELLSKSVDHYHRCYETETAVSWTSWSRIHALTAYDWLFPHLAEDKREQLGTDLLRAVAQVQPTEDRDSFAGENWSGPETGFYGTPSLLWYAGVAAHGAGIDDERAERFLEEGYELHTDLLEYRSDIAGDDGNPCTIALNYALGRYPFAEFNFFHTFESATGRAIAEDWPHLAGLPGYVFWNWLPGARHFGAGDLHHVTNRIPFRYLHLHLSQLVHFYGDEQRREVAFAKWLRERVPKAFSYEEEPFGFTRFLLSDRRPEIAPRGPPVDLPDARRFENLGQVFFRSGWGRDDAYALFSAGGRSPKHKHYDHNGFTIFKQGFLALDTGTRPEPGDPGNVSDHLLAYFPRTVAHNCVLVKMPGEEFPAYWGRTPEGGVPNDGGQRTRLGSTVEAYETNERYSYVAGDATETYHREKCDLALRQFLFVPPDHFVVFDRVRAAEPDYETTWLLHSAAEPDLGEGRFTVAHEEGRLVGHTLSPQRAEITARGGDGEQFWAGDRNWPLPDEFDHPDEHPLFGQWRVEVAPEASAEEMFFLHLLRTTDRSDDEFGEPTPIRTESTRGVRFDVADEQWEVTFGIDEAPSGRVSVSTEDGIAYEKSLTREVAEQRGLFGRRFDRADDAE